MKVWHHLLVPMGLVAIATIIVAIYQIMGISMILPNQDWVYRTKAVYPPPNYPFPANFPEITPPNRLEIKTYPPYSALAYSLESSSISQNSLDLSAIYQKIDLKDFSLTVPIIVIIWKA